MRRIYAWRWGFYLAGLCIMSLGITMVIKGEKIGVNAWDVLHIALYKTIGLSIGSWVIITGLVIVAFTSLMYKSFPKIGTWLNMLLTGGFIDFFYWLLPDADTFLFQLLYFLAGIFVLSFGTGMYISPNLGSGPRDGLMMWIVEKLGGSIKVARISIELTVALIGWLLGGPFGVGTILIAVGSGYIVQFALPYCQKLLLKCIGEEALEGEKPFIPVIGRETD
ncbi:YitT family protein [Ureibacillus sp. FSL K6-8385]|uniref:YitT family protein n=1 Tax=Ureibacillus terrenus TaxID=118246 RepID=A0A540V5P5_9BACL|nr:YitT family protein [Ureibacillus terrenus]MED3764253.1 YitT family protein [Ureibacillus terrenus]TQE92061.1 YitT family protein [Ureibacillus terrenus]